MTHTDTYISRIEAEGYEVLKTVSSLGRRRLIVQTPRGRVVAIDHPGDFPAHQRLAVLNRNLRHLERFRQPASNSVETSISGGNET